MLEYARPNLHRTSVSVLSLFSPPVVLNRITSQRCHGSSPMIRGAMQHCHCRIFTVPETFFSSRPFSASAQGCTAVARPATRADHVVDALDPSRVLAQLQWILIGPSERESVFLAQHQIKCSRPESEMDHCSDNVVTSSHCEYLLLLSIRLSSFSPAE